MNLTYTSKLEESQMNLTDFNCVPSQLLLKEQGRYKVIWAMEKAIQMTIDGYDLTLAHNEVLFCTPLNIVEIPIGQMGMRCIVFNREFYCIRDHDEEVSCNGLLFFGTAQPTVILLDEAQVKVFNSLFTVFHEEFRHKDAVQGEMLRALLKYLLIKSTRLAKTSVQKEAFPQDKVDVIRKFNLLVEKNFKTYHKVGDYADLLFKSPKTISNLFKQYYNKTPLTVINERIIMEAKRLLLFSDATAEEIAFELGYKEAGHFSKFFKKNVGTSPIEFRKNASELQ